TSISDLILRQLHEPLPSVLLRQPDLPPALDDIIRRATVKNPDNRYSDVLSVAADFKRAILPETSASSPHPTAETQPLARNSPDMIMITDEESEYVILTPDNPYKGLRAFEEADAGDFFGREAFVGKLVEHLTGKEAPASFLAVVGPSGSGKSS